MYIIGSILLLLILIALLLQTPPAQNFIKNKAVSFITEKIGTEFRVGKFRVDFPYDLVIEDLYIEDQNEDTLAYVKKLRVEAEMWGLFKGEISISDIQINKFIGYMSKNEADSTFNFDFIIDAFTTADTVATDTSQTQSPFDITIDGIQITNSKLYYVDPVSGFDMEYGVGNLDIAINRFDLNNNIIKIGEVVLKNSYGEFTINKEAPPSDEPTEPFVFDIEVNDVLIADVRFNFESIPDQIKVLTEVGELKGKIDRIDINEMNYFADNLALSNSSVEVDLYGETSNDDQEDQATSAMDSITLDAGAKRVTFSNVRFRFDDHSVPKTSSGFDPMHFAFTDIHAEVKDPDYTLKDIDNYASGEVLSLSLKEEEGMVLKKLNGIAKFTPTFMQAKDIDLNASNTEIHGDFKMTYESLETLAENPQEMGLNIDLNPTIVDLDDVIYFVPEMKQQLASLPPSARTMRMSGEVTGKLAALDINNFSFNGLRNTHFHINGQINGIPNVKDLYADLALSDFTITRLDIETLLPDTLLPEDITIPEKISMQGQITGSLEKAKGNLKIQTSLGNAAINASIAMKNDTLYSYDGRLEVNQFNVGKLLQQEEQFGVLTANIQAEGEGFTLDEINTKLKGTVKEFTYNEYTYNDLDINGEIFKHEFSGNLAMEDENLDFTFEGTVNLNDSIPAFMFYMDLQTVDLQALNFTEEDIRIKGTIDSDLRVRNFKQISGHVDIKDVVVFKDKKRYKVDSLMFNSVKQGRDTKVTINSDILSARFEGEFEIIDLPKVIQAHINQYYELMDTTVLEGVEPQSFTFNVNFWETDLITEVLVPDLESFTPGEISGTYNSENWEMDIKVEIEEMNYAGMIIDSLNISITSDEEELNYNARVATFQTGMIPIDNIWLEGIVASNHINTALHIQDDEGEDKYLIGGIFTTWEEHYYQLQLTPGRVIMNYEKWEVYPGNSIQFYPSGLIIEDVRLSYNEQQISANTRIDEQQDTLINIGFNNFKLSTIGNLDAQDTSFVTGLVNGKANLNTSADALAFTSDLSIRNLAYKTDTLGNLSINAYTNDSKRYSVTASLDGRESEALIEGFYDADTLNGLINLDVDIAQLDFKTIEAFSMGELEDSRGYLTADLSIAGAINNPSISGTVGFKDAMTRVSYLGSFMLIDDEQIRFDKQGIHFNRFTINDGSGNNFNINGEILTSNYEHFKFNLNASMRNFLLLNTGAGDNPLYYGSLIVDSDIVVRGDSDLPVINMDINLNDESRMTYIVPEENISSIEREGLIEFVDRVKTEDGRDSLISKSEDPQDTLSTFQGIDFTANINLDESNRVSIVIDPATGDRLDNLRGNANLSLNINPTGDMSLNGRYTVEEGSYTLRLFGLARREFSIVEGSYLLWTGDPLNARMSITAQYQIEVNPQPILTSAQNLAKQPILVNLNLEGRLLSPEIDFRLSMPEGEQHFAVMNALQRINNNESHKLEQVLSLVIFQRFMQEGNMFAGGGGGIAESTARQSVSRILSQQLNQLGGQIGGVDLSFDVQSYQDYSQTGEPYRTEVEMGVSKAFFDDRVNVKVAGAFDVEGERSQQNNMSDFAGDVIIEYMITEDGRFRLVAFRKNEWDDLLGSEIIETGIGIIFIKEYNSFSELFNDIN